LAAYIFANIDMPETGAAKSFAGNLGEKNFLKGYFHEIFWDFLKIIQLLTNYYPLWSI
jgi:hypothetical protein